MRHWTRLRRPLGEIHRSTTSCATAEGTPRASCGGAVEHSSLANLSVAAGAEPWIAISRTMNQGATDIDLLTELDAVFPHVSAGLLKDRRYRRCRVRRLGGSAGSVGVGGRGGGFVDGDRLEVGAVSVARSGRSPGRCGGGVLRRPAGGGTQRGDGPLVWDGLAAVVPVPVGGRCCVGSRDPVGGPRFLPVACDHERPEAGSGLSGCRIRCRCGRTARRSCGVSTISTVMSARDRW